MSASSESGRISLLDGEVRYESRDYGSWSFSISDLRIVGEYTTDVGPGIDDWFVIFVTSTASDWYAASAYSDGADAFRMQLARELRVDSLDHQLAASTDFASRILWPPSSHGRPLFRFTPIPIPWWRRVLHFGRSEMRVELSSEARQNLGPPA